MSQLSLLDSLLKSCQKLVSVTTILINQWGLMNTSSSERDKDLAEAKRISDEINLLSDKIRQNQHTLSLTELNELCDEVSRKTDDVERILSKHI